MIEEHFHNCVTLVNNDSDIKQKDDNLSPDE